MCAQISTTFPDSTYTSSNLPSADTLKADIAAIETGANETDTYSVRSDGTVALTANQVSSATPAAATHLATMGAIYPVGAVFLSVVSTDPSTLLGFGTWSRIAEAQMLVGFKTGDADFGTVMGTGGAKTVSVAHTHTGPSHTHTGPSHTHTGTTSTQSANHQVGSANEEESVTTHSHTFTTAAGGTGNTGAGGTGNTGAMSANATPSIINPYYTVYAWKRVS